MAKKTDKLTKKQVIAIQGLLNKRKLSVGEIAKLYGVTWNAIWYWVHRLRADGFELKTRKKGQTRMILK